MAAASDLRPRTVGEILDAAFVLYRRHFGPLLLAATVVSVPTLAVALVLASPAGAAFASVASAYVDYVHEVQGAQGQWTKAVQESYFRTLRSAMDLNVYVYASALAQSLSRAGAFLAAAAVTRAAVRREPLPGGWAMVGGLLPRLPAATVLWTANAVVTAMCSICLPVPVLATAVVAPACAVLAFERGDLETSARGLPLALRWAVTPFAGALDATIRCVRLSAHGMTLVRGSFLVGALLTFVTGIVTLVSGAAALAWESLGAWFVANHWAEVLFLPAVGVAYALWYEDLRVRREAADFEPAVPARAPGEVAA